ncbi:His-Xaa-Ser system radical SAM maturase HxsB [Paludibaculum fermentans]|uniref:His-Xaa-Ser system radical SAM maturase HxsB n=1 Tax=Paludibaculum fermentans TaxID=1473598 RepID=UPI003EB818A6
MPRLFYTPPTYGGHSPKYQLLPFRYTRMDGEELLVNEAGEYQFVPNGVVDQLVRHQLSTTTGLYQTLKAKHFVHDGDSSPLLDILATKIRTKKAFLEQGVTLHIMVLTLRCEHSCQYCQVSRQTADRTTYDMSTASIERSLSFMMRFPGKHLTLEFQGGEPLLAFESLRYAVGVAKELAAKHGKTISFVVCTNLAVSTDHIFRYLRDENIKISTSLDGPAIVHNANRLRSGGSSYDVTIANIRRAREWIGHENVGALMTTSRFSLAYPREIVDEYVAQGFGSIFLRAINPYGFAVKTVERTGYDSSEFLSFYGAALDHIITLNRNGTNLMEVYATLILAKILTPYTTGYVDLQSPTGAGISVLVYNYDGKIYASDESRMLAEMNDQTFRLGNVHEDTYLSMVQSPAFQYLLSASCNEALPGCAECAYQPYCGADPVRHHATQRDAIGHRPTGTFCQKNLGIITDLFRRIRTADPALQRIFFAWIRNKPHGSLISCD